MGGRDEWRGWWSESTRVRISHDVSFYAKCIMIVRKRRGLYYIAFVRKRFSTLEMKGDKDDGGNNVQEKKWHTENVVRIYI